MPQLARNLIVGAGSACLLGLVAACGQDAPSVAESRAASTAPAPPSGPPQYIGTWAAEPERCGKAVWSIVPGRLVTDSGGSCDLSQVQATATGWVAQAACTGAESGMIELNTTGSEPTTLVVSGAAWASPITLVKCPIAPGAEPSRDPHTALDQARRLDTQIAQGGPAISEREVRNNALLRKVWRQDGQIIKLLAPIVGGEHGGGERAYYFRPGEPDPFLVSGPSGSYAFFQGRLVTTFTPEGEIMPELQTREVASQERGFLQQARTLREIAENLEPNAAGGG
jgi:hypothetical protein